MEAVVAREITKTYRVGVGRARVREMVPSPFDRALQRVFPKWWWKDTFNALQDVSVSIPNGASVGIVGPNGAGKTTLLRIISGVTSPTLGAIQVSGRVGALLDVTIGFHPQLTGRENVYLLGAVHGLGQRSMEPRVDQILEFAEIEELADTPLKRYSAGMAARLGFATITAIDLGILLVDEVLAVGDASFQRKCVRWLDDYQARGGTLMFVSHNLSLVRSMTQRVIWLDHGRVRADGPTEEILGRYARAMEHRDTGVPAHQLRKAARKVMRAEGLRRWGAGGVRVEEVHIRDVAQKGAALDITVTYETSEVEEGTICVGFVDESGREIGAAASPSLSLGAKGRVVCSLHSLDLRSGIYFPVVAILSSDGLVRDRWRLDRALVVEGDGDAGLAGDFGPVSFPADWSEMAEGRSS